MSSEQSYTRNQIKKISLYAMLTAVCIIIGYVESLVELSFIAPGVKVGLSNSIACVLVFYGDIKGAFAVNISRILLTALLFGSPVSLCFALAGGIISLTVMALLKKCRFLSVIGVSALGGVFHNVAQCAVGLVFVGRGVIFYLPVLLAFGVACGAAVGVLSKLILARIGKSEKNVR